MRPVSMALLLVLFSGTAAQASIPCGAEIFRHLASSSAELAATRLSLMTCLARAQALEDALLDAVESQSATDKSFVVVDSVPASFGLFVEPGEDPPPGLGQPDAPGTMYSCNCPGNGATGYDRPLLQLFRPSEQVFEGIQPQPIRPEFRPTRPMLELEQN